MNKRLEDLRVNYLCKYMTLAVQESSNDRFALPTIAAHLIDQLSKLTAFVCEQDMEEMERSAEVMKKLILAGSISAAKRLMEPPENKESAIIIPFRKKT